MPLIKKSRPQNGGRDIRRECLKEYEVRHFVSTR